MIIEYLNKCRVNINIKIDKYNEILRELCFQLENEKLRLKELHDLENDSYILFSPRNSSIVIDEKKKECKALIEKLNNDIYDLKSKVSLEEDELEELNIVISNFNKFEINVNEAEDKKISIFNMQELERKRIALDIHDSVIQNVTFLLHKVEYCKHTFYSDRKKCKNELDHLDKHIHGTIDSLRKIIFDLYPMEVEDLDIEKIFEREISRFQSIDGFKISFNYNVLDELEIESNIKLNLLRVLQESLSNISKYAEASLVEIAINKDDNYLLINIKDNGKGFDIISEMECKECNGLGIKSMNERIKLLKGNFNLYSVLNIGTEISICVPIE